MNKQVLFLFLINCNVLLAMDRYKNIKSSSEAPLLLNFAKICKVEQDTIDYYAQLIIDPAKIKNVTKEPCVSSDTESYYATLLDGNNACCTYFPTGQCAEQIWANHTLRLILNNSTFKLELPIHQKNFFILKSHYEAQKKP